MVTKRPVLFRTTVCHRAGYDGLKEWWLCVMDHKIENINHWLKATNINHTPEMHISVSLTQMSELSSYCYSIGVYPLSLYRLLLFHWKNTLLRGLRHLKTHNNRHTYQNWQKLKSAAVIGLGCGSVAPCGQHNNPKHTYYCDKVALIV